MFNPDATGSIKESLKTRIAVAAGREPADIVLKNASMVDVFGSQVMTGVDIAIQDQRIAGISNEGYSGREEIDLTGQVVVPGLMDGHIHIESTMLTIREFARCVVPRGTTTVIIDPHEIANVLGFEGIMYILESAKYQPLSIHVCLPSCVPATDLETSGSKLSAFDLLSLFQNKWVVALAEMMNFPGVINADSGVLEKIELAGQMARPIDGHAPGLRGKNLNAYVTANVRSDHECVSADEAAEKLSLGMHIMIREGSLAKNLETLLPLVTERNHTQFMFVTDDRHPHTLRDEGHMDSIIRKAIRLGLDPVLAVKLATINTANYFRLYSVGAIAPGRRADLVVVDDLKSFNVRSVYKNGRLVARDGGMTYEAPARREPSLRSTVNIRWLEDHDFDVPAVAGAAGTGGAGGAGPANGGKMRVIEIIPRSLYTKEIHVTPKIENGLVVADPERDIAKIVVIDRHRATNISVGFVKGFGIKHGAWGQTIAHDSHNIIAVGTNDLDIKKAVVRLRKIGGGIVVAQDEQVLEQLPLPVAGLMTDIPFAQVTEALDRLMKVMREKVGCQVDDPFMALAFVALPVIPDLKITDHGLIDVNQFKAVPLWVE